MNKKTGQHTYIQRKGKLKPTVNKTSFGKICTWFLVVEKKCFDCKNFIQALTKGIKS